MKHFKLFPSRSTWLTYVRWKYIGRHVSDLGQSKRWRFLLSPVWNCEPLILSLQNLIIMLLTWGNFGANLLETFRRIFFLNVFAVKHIIGHIMGLVWPIHLEWKRKCVYAKQVDVTYGFTGGRWQKASMLQCVYQYIQYVSLYVSILYSLGNLLLQLLLLPWWNYVFIYLEYVFCAR